MVSASDTFLVAGCAFTLPPGVPSPCVQILWLVPETRVKLGGAPALDAACTGMCMAATGAPQGPPTVQTTQNQVKGE